MRYKDLPFMEALTEEKAKGPSRALCIHLQEAWPSIKPEVDQMENLVRFE